MLFTHRTERFLAILLIASVVTLASCRSQGPRNKYIESNNKQSQKILKEIKEMDKKGSKALRKELRRAKRASRRR